MNKTWKKPLLYLVVFSLYSSGWGGSCGDGWGDELLFLPTGGGTMMTDAIGKLSSKRSFLLMVVLRAICD